MRNFLMNWNYKKHAATVSSFYLGLAILGNAFLGKKVPSDEKSMRPVTVCKQMTNKQHIFNGILTFCYSIDMTLSFLLLSYWKKQYK
ncbi:hypothetical protein [Anaerovorax sp. IOR16]|uniref:hypothetical protein n=1 Tax=Anaerovorax sp. IOR16 TaxID=2773458 RepID=UPI0019D00272|nr:hypothetical protein [Anaerovorax sp. IOR16]